MPWALANASAQRFDLERRVDAHGTEALDHALEREDSMAELAHAVAELAATLKDGLIGPATNRRTPPARAGEPGRDVGYRDPCVGIMAPAVPAG